MPNLNDRYVSVTTGEFSPRPTFKFESQKCSKTEFSSAAMAAIGQYWFLERVRSRIFEAQFDAIRVAKTQSRGRVSPPFFPGHIASHAGPARCHVHESSGAHRHRPQ